MKSHSPAVRAGRAAGRSRRGCRSRPAVPGPVRPDRAGPGTWRSCRRPRPPHRQWSSPGACRRRSHRPAGAGSGRLTPTAAGRDSRSARRGGRTPHGPPGGSPPPGAGRAPGPPPCRRTGPPSPRRSVPARPSPPRRRFPTSWFPPSPGPPPRRNRWSRRGPGRRSRGPRRRRARGARSAIRPRRTERSLRLTRTGAPPTRRSRRSWSRRQGRSGRSCGAGVRVAAPARLL